ncbi:AAA family ATPase [Streptomyces sp. NPDC057456]|uniref:helix-turn-helix transcriptional regulator n=1 Tax=Streptomyces sp. NPDC057456 TaxID=3346139 RepID=UPI0036816BBF
MSETPFFGRADALEQLGDRLTRAARSEPQIVLIDGPAGMGKTSLIRRFLAAVRPGCHVLRASGEEIEMHLPYGVTAQLLAHARNTADAPEEELDHTGRPGGPVPDPIAVGSCLLDALGRIQDHVTGVVVIDDVHWADTPSLHALTFVLRRLRFDRVLTLLVTRDATDPRLPPGLRRIMLADTTLHLTLGGLGLSELTALNAAVGPTPLPRWAIARLREHTDGNPLHTRALLQQLPAEVLVGGNVSLPAPRAYERLIAERLETCAPHTRRLVGAVSVLGMSSPLHLAAEIGTVPDPLEALSEAMARELLEEGAVGSVPRAVFPHPLLRAAVYHGLEPAERSRLHSLAAGGVHEPGIALRHRVHAAVGPDEELADDLVRFAVGQGAEGAWSTAASASLAAARLSTDASRGAQRTLRAVEYLLLAGDVSQAAELVQTVREMSPGAEQHYVLGHQALTAGRLDEARRELNACWESGDAATETLRSAAEQLAWLCLIQGDARGIVHWARRGLDLPPGTRSSFLRDSLAIGLAISGDFAEGMASLAHLPASGPRDSPEQLDGLLGRGMLHLWNGQLSDARRDLEDAFASHRRGGLPYAALVALGFLTDAEYRSGRWDDAIAHGTQAVSLAEDTDQISILAVVHAVTACPLAGRGDFRAAEAHAIAAAEHARVLGDVNDTAFAATALALVHTGRGHHEGTVAALSPLLRQDITHRNGIDEAGLVPWRPLLVEALVRTGRTDAAEEVLVPYEAGAAGRRRWLDQAAAARCRGILEGARGDAEAAERAFLAGLGHCDRGEPCWEQALVRLSYGVFLRRAGRRGSAVAELEVAWRTFHRLRATPYLERTDAELAACGRVAARPRDAVHPLLTAQELTVAKMAARGLTNRHIARELVLSVKTIEYHLGNTYAKLGISSRTDLVDKLARNT